ncbi:MULTISPECIES: DUF4259 domain-containing protein [Streptomyces]|uniref:DUF4259 domain-containing protein n=1 Tax=Streptomyces solicathayae TaxID=3081768 RepID=A0ABZ0M0T0_9ACTN|nr:DUF4259 domain-containing protein [Streptomyces sp. HUAS YS2]WOX24659.1 DUF4259 domain-containing protein [Streptomyces sp. HUAS YS2]
MGTWDIGHFDNDSAADFGGALGDLPRHERPGLIRAQFLAVIGTGEEFLDSDEAATALAAAALVAAQCPGGDPVTTAYGPDEPLPELPLDLRPLAVQALDRILGPDSELVELWEESADGGLWRDGVLRLRGTIAAATS